MDARLTTEKEKFVIKSRIQLKHWVNTELHKCGELTLAWSHPHPQPLLNRRGKKIKKLRAQDKKHGHP